MADLIDTTEMYLRTILELEEEGVPPLRARISERLEHSGPTVSQTVGRMERDGLVVVTDDRRLQFTAAGREKAIQVMRKHRLAERLLSDVIGLEWEFVHDEACRWEHVMSEQVEKKLIKMLGFPKDSPYGNPIPGLEALGDHSEEKDPGVISVTKLLETEDKVSRPIKRLAEPAQVDPEMLILLANAGIVPGGYATFTKQGNLISVTTDKSDVEVELQYDFASFIFVER